MGSLKSFLVILFLSILAQGHTAIEENEIYLDTRMEVVNNKKQATYVCNLDSETERGFLFKVYFLSGEIKMEGTYKSIERLVAHGEFTYYYQSGQIESRGEYRDGEKYGIWQRFDAQGNERSEKIYASLPMLNAIAKEKIERQKKK